MHAIQDWMISPMGALVGLVLLVLGLLIAIGYLAYSIDQGVRTLLGRQVR